MKPLLSIQSNRGAATRRFPITDCNYRLLDFGEFNARCANLPRPSFITISRDYFNREARHNFVIETLVFALVTVASVPAIVDCGRALFEFARAIGSV